MELLPYLPIDPSTLSLSVLDVSSLSLSDGMEFLRLNPIYQARVLSLEHLIKDAGITFMSTKSFRFSRLTMSGTETTRLYFYSCSFLSTITRPKTFFSNRSKSVIGSCMKSDYAFTLLYPTEADLHLRTRKQFMAFIYARLT